MEDGVERDKARDPEDIPRLFMMVVQAGDYAGLATLYEDDAILALPPGEITTGNQAIAAVFGEILGDPQRSGADGSEQRPVLRCGDPSR